MKSLAIIPAIALLVNVASPTPSANAQDYFNQGKLLATGGVSQIEGAGGAGLSTWALITGYGTDKGIGLNAHHSYARTGDFTLNASGVAVGLFDRVELSYTHQWFDTRDAGARLGIGAGYTFEQDIVGAKVRLAGDAVYDQDNWMPQVAIGATYRSNKNGALVTALGADSDSSYDVYASATKLFLAQSLLASATLRLSEANQFGLLGYGSTTSGHSIHFEGSLVYMLRRDLVIGADFRTKPNNLAFAKEQDAFALYGAYFLNKNISLTAAWVSLGEIALQGKQNGVYLSVQLGF